MFDRKTSHKKTKKNTRWKLTSSLIFLAVIGSFGIWWIHGISPVNTGDHSKQTFIVQQGEPLKQIATHLQQAGLINDSTIFSFIVKQMGIDNKIQSGEFMLSPSMTAQEIATTLEKGTLDVWVRISEGKRADEIADMLQKQFPQYSENWRIKLEVQEGFLFPDTYRFSRSATIDQIIQTLDANFNQKFDSLPTNPDNPYTLKQIITVASLISREAKYPADQTLVASVIYNRLKNSMPLQIDATIQYALGYQSLEKTWWKNNLTLSDLQINSPYNTYTYIGLPPTPIANPGLAAIAAAVRPAQTNYLFYISDKYGNIHYATTLEQHDANIKKYGAQ